MIYNTTVDISEDSERFEPRDLDIQCTKGSDFLWFIRVKVPKLGDGWNATDDASGNGARMHWRSTIDAASTVLDAHTTGTPAYMAIDESDPENLLITVDIPAADTDSIVFSGASLGTAQGKFRSGGQGVYDREVVLASGRVFRILEGAVTTSDEVTR